MSGMRRVLAHRGVHAGKVYRLAIADISGPEIVVEPFSVETAGTPFVDGTVFILSASSMTYAPEWAGNASEAVLAAVPEILDCIPDSIPGIKLL